MSGQSHHAKTPIAKTPDPPTGPNPAVQETDLQKSIKHEEETPEMDGAEEGECGFCLFMKGGGCKDTFTAWEECIEEGEKNGEDIVGKCYQATTNLKNCMEANSDYYAPLLEAEKKAEEEAAKQLEEKKSSGSEKTPDPPTDPNPAENPAVQETPSVEDLQKPIKHEEETPKEDNAEEGECGFCLFMKGGGCKDTFTAWEECIEEGEKNGEDVVGKCYQTTTNLMKCMEANSGYYAPLLEAEKKAQEEVAKQLEEEKKSSGSG